MMRRIDYVTIPGKEVKQDEEQHICKELAANNYPTSFIQNAKRNINKEHGKPPFAYQAKKKENITVSIPYVKGVSETIKRLLGPLGVKTVMRTQQRKWRLM